MYRQASSIVLPNKGPHSGRTLALNLEAAGTARTTRKIQSSHRDRDRRRDTQRETATDRETERQRHRDRHTPSHTQTHTHTPSRSPSHSLSLWLLSIACSLTCNFQRFCFFFHRLASRTPKSSWGERCLLVLHTMLPVKQEEEEEEEEEAVMNCLISHRHRHNLHLRHQLKE